MAELWRKAKQFIGLEEEEEGGVAPAREEVHKDPETGLIRFRSSRRSSGGPELEVAVYEPKVYEDSLSISARLRQGNPVVINLKFLDPDEGTRLVDFVCGAAYAIDGHMMRIGESIFLFTPNNILINQVEEKPAAISEELAK